MVGVGSAGPGNPEQTGPGSLVRGKASHEFLWQIKGPGSEGIVGGSGGQLDSVPRGAGGGASDGPLVNPRRSASRPGLDPTLRGDSIAQKLCQTRDTALVPPLIDIIPFVAIAAIIYFLILKPQIDERKQHDALLASLARDDRVVTSSGIHGKVAEVGPTTVVLELAERTRVTFEKSAIARREGDPAPTKGS